MELYIFNVFSMIFSHIGDSAIETVDCLESDKRGLIAPNQVMQINLCSWTSQIQSSIQDVFRESLR